MAIFQEARIYPSYRPQINNDCEIVPFVLSKYAIGQCSLKIQPLAQIDTLLASPEFKESHSDFSDDYEQVCIPMEFGSPSPTPPRTRNPADDGGYPQVDSY